MLKKAVKKYIKHIAKNILAVFSGKLQYQKMFAHLHRFALKGMNIGEGASINEDGELHALHYVKNELSKNKKTPYVIFDVGANVGEYTEKVEDAFGDTGAKIFSFEPSQKTFEKLKSHTQRIRNVSLHNIALGEESRADILYSDKEGSGLASIYKRRLDHFNLAMDKTEEIKHRTWICPCDDMQVYKYCHCLLFTTAEGKPITLILG